MPDATQAASPAIDASLLDASVNPGEDFYAFVNGKWIAANPIPADRARWGTFDQLTEKSLEEQHCIVEEAAIDADRSEPGSIERKIGLLFRAGMDAEAIERAGFDPIKPKLRSIHSLQSPEDIVAWLAESFAEGDEQVFLLYPQPDFCNAEVEIAYARQGGLGLPTPDYYTNPDHEAMRRAYVGHIERFFILTGEPSDAARASAAEVLVFETRLAGYSLSPVELRDPNNEYHFVTFDEAAQITPHIDWAAFLSAQGVEPGEGFSLSQPGFFAGVDALLTDASIDSWKAYLAFHVISDAAPFLAQAFQDEDFVFRGRTLSGQPEQRPRWKRVLATVNGAMGQALGQLYVARYFPPEAKQRALELVDQVRGALKERIRNLDWMSESTKHKALEKWEKFLPKIGYPDEWRDWSGLAIEPGNYFANVVAAAKFNYQYEMAKVGKRTDRREWVMTPQTVNAYYSPNDNTINFPAAILQPPFFYADGDDAVNYGGIGAVIGHEAIHGFDDQGSQFDGGGNHVDWWTKADRAQFEARTAKLVEQFNEYAPLPDHADKHVDGQLTLGENIADLGGVNVAHDALRNVLSGKPDEAVGKIDGLTQDQRFFVSWVRNWRSSVRPEHQLMLLNVDPHSPARFRAIGPVSNMPAFAAAFGCRPEDPMVRSGNAQVKIW